jgi:hypothetical protein
MDTEALERRIAELECIEKRQEERLREALGALRDAYEALDAAIRADAKAERVQENEARRLR